MSLPLSNVARATLWALASVAGATAMTVCVRLLSPDFHTAMTAFLRSILGLALLLPALIRVQRTGEKLQFTDWKLHLLRGVCIVIALNSGFYALWKLPLATATILFFLAPVFVTVLAGPFLGEVVGPRRWAAVGVGFLGALIILRPDQGTADPVMIVAIVSSMAFAAALLLGKVISRTDSTDSIFVSTAVTVAILTLPPAIFFWKLPVTWEHWIIVIGLVLGSGLRTIADIKSYALGDAGYLAPFSYLRLLTIGLIGYFFFGEVIDTPTWIGGAVVISATLYIAIREAQVRRRRNTGHIPREGLKLPPTD